METGANTTKTVRFDLEILGKGDRDDGGRCYICNTSFGVMFAVRPPQSPGEELPALPTWATSPTHGTKWSRGEEMTIYAEKLLPHSIEAEESVLGAILIDPDCVTRLVPNLKGTDFYRERNQLVYDAAVALANRDMAVDQTTIASELARRESLDLVGGMAYLSHLVAITPTSVHAEDYAAIVSKKATLRKLITAASRISELGYSDTDDAEEAIRQAENALYAIRDTNRLGDFISLREAMDRYLESQAANYDLARFQQRSAADRVRGTGRAPRRAAALGYGDPGGAALGGEEHPGTEHGPERRQGPAGPAPCSAWR